MNLGTINSGGNLASWAADDNDARTICKLYVPAMDTPFARIRLVFDPDTTAVPSSLEIRVKIPWFSPGVQHLYLRMPRDGMEAEATTIDNERIVAGTTYIATPLQPLENYVRADGTIHVLVEVWQRGPSTAIFPCTSFEFANMLLTY